MDLTLTLTALFALAPPSTDGTGLHFVDVGQGSALILRGPDDTTVLVDAGPAGGAEALLRALAEHDIDAIDLWIFTHHDADHIGGFAPALAGLDGRPHTDDDLQVMAIWDRGLDEPLPNSEALALYLNLADSLRSTPVAGTRFEHAGLRIEVLELDPPPASADVGENDRGLSLCVELDGVRALVPGDASVARVELAAAACAGVDVLWLSHHGSADASSRAVIELADPELIVISAGHANAYCHPSASALALAARHTTYVLDGAGVDPRAGCPPLVDALASTQQLLGGDLWLDTQLHAWVGGPPGWAPLH